MKITFIINSLSYKSSTERVACHLANLFVEKLNRDTIFENVAYPLHQDISVYALTGNYLQFYQKIQYYLKQRQPDYIIHNMGRLSLLCSVLNKNNTKLISLEHVAFDSRPVWVQKLSKFCYKNINKVVTLTYKDDLSYQSWFNDTTTIYNISPFPICESKNRSKDIIAVDRLTYQKNFQALLQAWQQIHQQIDGWSLKIYGTSEDFEELSAIIKNHHFL